MEREKINPTRPRPVDVDADTNIWRLEIPVRTENIQRGVGETMKEALQKPDVVTQRRKFE